MNLGTVALCYCNLLAQYNLDIATQILAQKNIVFLWHSSTLTYVATPGTVTHVLTCRTLVNKQRGRSMYLQTLYICTHVERKAYKGSMGL